jgi:hypothetical protein
MNAFKILHWPLLKSFGNCLSILNIVALFFFLLFRFVCEYNTFRTVVEQI